MSPKHFLFVVLLAGIAPAWAQPGVELVERTALDGRVSLLVPAEFGPMSEAMLEVKYPSGQRPTEVLTNERGSINVAFNHTTTAMTPAQVPEAHPAIEQMFRDLFPTARWNASDVETRDGRTFVVLDLWTPAIDTEIRNLIVGTSVEGRFLLVSFNVTRELEEKWGPVGEQIMRSIRVHR